MRYEITDISPLVGARDVRVEVAYWHDDNALPNAEPDFIDEHYIINLPSSVPQLTYNELGQVLRTDGSWEVPWREVNGAWEQWLPAPGTSGYVWTTPPDDPATAIAATMDRRGDVVAQERPTGDQRALKGHRPAAPPGLALGHIANRGAVRQLIGRRRTR